MYRKWNMNKEQFEYYDDGMSKRDKELFDYYRLMTAGLEYNKALDKLFSIYENDNRLRFTRKDITRKTIETKCINFDSKHEDREDHIINDCVYRIVADLKRAKHFKGR